MPARDPYFLDTPPYPHDPSFRRHIVDGISLHGLLSQIDVEQRMAWRRAPGPKVLVYLAAPHRFNREESFSRIKAAVAYTLRPGARFTVAAPTPNRFVLDADPKVHLVWDISQSDADFLACLNFWSFYPFGDTFFTFKWSDEPSPFNHTAVGFPQDDNTRGRDEVTRHLKGTMAWSPRIRRFVARFNDGFPPGTPKTVQTLLEKAEVTTFHIPDADDYTRYVLAWNFFIGSPTRQPALHRAWKALVAEVVCESFGGVFSITAYVCGICLGVSHPTTRCPLPFLPRWRGPPAENHPAQYTPATYAPARHIAFTGESTFELGEEAWLLGFGTCVEGNALPSE